MNPYDSLAALRAHRDAIDAKIRELEQEHVVRVRFDGSARLYAFELPPGREPWVGDFVMANNRIVKVRELGRGDYTGRLSPASRVHVEVLD